MSTLLSIAAWRGDSAHLSHDTKHVKLEPGILDFAINDAMDNQTGKV
jgi:hypothetical protein